MTTSLPWWHSPGIKQRIYHVEPAKVADGEALPLRLKWRQTWPDRDADYAAHADSYGDIVGRIYRHDSGEQAGNWFWSMTAFGPETSRNVDGLYPNLEEVQGLRSEPTKSRSLNQFDRLALRIPNDYTRSPRSL